MRMFRLQQEQWIQSPIAEVFEFFSNAANLQILTPDWLSFEIVTPMPVELNVGALIDYRLKVRGLPLNWQSEITEWNPPYHFVDEQKRGPYRQWHHTHEFREQDGGTLVVDTIEYAVPGGHVIHTLFVKRDVERIFKYRQEKLEEIFQSSAQDGLVKARNIEEQSIHE